MTADVRIVGMGARTAVGHSAPQSAAAVRAGLRRISDHPFMVDARGNPLRAALDEGIDPTLLGGGRLMALGRSALGEALASIGEALDLVTQIDVLLAAPETRPGFSDANAAWLARDVTRGLLPERLARPAELAPRGHAGALDALREAARRIAEGRSEICAVLGVDSYFAPDTIDWLDANRQLAGEGIRDGFVPGEGAGCVILAGGTIASMYRLPTLAVVRGAYSAREARVIKGEQEVLGQGLTAALLGAAASLRLPAEAVDDVYCDMNGERYRTDEWAFTVLRANEVLRDSAYKMPATSWGDVGAASGALGCVLAARAWARGYARGPRALVWGSSEGGLRSAAVLEQPRGG